MKKNILLTGLPGCGKTTFIRRIADLLSVQARGFYTGEIRKKGLRKGFLIRTLEGKEAYLAHVDVDSRYKVRKYSVSIENIESVAVPSILNPLRGEIIVIDEIGKMECFSKKFREAVTQALNSPAFVLASIALKASGFINDIKKRSDVEIIEITRFNRDSLADYIIAEIRNQ